MLQAFQAFVITSREGIEAFLIVAISLAYLRKGWPGGIDPRRALGHRDRRRAQRRRRISPLSRGQPGNAGRTAGDRRRRVGRGDDRPHVAREPAHERRHGRAAANVHPSRGRRRVRRRVPVHGAHDQPRGHGNGAAADAAAGDDESPARRGLGRRRRRGVAWLWSRYGHRVNLSLFFQVTALFLFVFVVQLFIRGIHEMSEQNFLPYSEIIHASTEAWGPDSAFGHLLTYLLVMLPAFWLLIKSSIAENAGDPVTLL